MKTPDQPIDASDHETATDDAVDALLRAALRDPEARPTSDAEPGVEPSAERATRVRAEVRGAWAEVTRSADARPAHDEVRQHRARRALDRASDRTPRRPWLLAAALVLAALAAAWLLRTAETPVPAPAEITVATVRSLTGTVLRAQTPGDIGTPIAIGDRLSAGDILRTGIARVALRVETERGTADLRLDRSSEARFGLDGRIELDQGGLYAAVEAASLTDPVAGPGRQGLHIVTPLGSARDIGTRFAVRLADGALDVAVRDGIVEVATPAARHRADAGTAVAIAADGQATLRPLASFDTLWTWTATLAPAFDLDGASLKSFLAWLSDESGWTIRFADSDLAQRAEDWQMRGPVIENLRPEDALALALRPNELAHHIEDGVVTIRRDEP